MRTLLFGSLGIIVLIHVRMYAGWLNSDYMLPLGSDIRSYKPLNLCDLALKSVHSDATVFICSTVNKPDC